MKQHPYCYAGTDVYKNKENIRDRAALERLERTLSAVQLETLPHNLPISPSGYREIHRYLLDALYDWAGKDRWIDTGRTGPFCKAAYIIPELNRRFASLNAENDLRGLAADAFAERAAEHVNEINAIHPFLDGNGRTLRAFLQILGEQAGHAIELARIAPNAWNEASRVGYHLQDYRSMRGIIAETLRV